MYAISADQIKGARAMLGWSQEALALASKLCVATIRNLEKGHLSPRSASDVRAALEGAGLQFFENDGLSRRTDEVKVYQGLDSSDRFFDDVIQTIREKGGDLAAISKSPTMLVQSLGAGNAANQDRLEQLSERATVKCLLSEVHGASPLPIDFRAIPRFYAGHSHYFLYGDKYAIVLAEDGAAFRYVVFKSMSLTQANWREFLPLWHSAVPVETRRQIIEPKRRATA